MLTTSQAPRIQNASTKSSNLQSLPNELLEDILEIICKDELSTPLARSAHWQQLQPSHVSRRFREVTINEARLWSHITFKSTVEWVDVLLKRSGDHGLVIDFSEHHVVTRYSLDACSCPEMMRRALEHKSRWKEVRLGARLSILVHNAITPLLTNVTLPSLRCLIFPEDGPHSDGTGRLCLSWTMPKLEELRCSDEVCQVPYELRIPLKRFRYTEQLGETIGVDMTHYLMQTQCIASVEELTLRFTQPLEDRVNATYHVVRMENLRRFTVDFTRMLPNEAADKFFEYIDPPAMEVFEFKQDRSCESAMEDRISDEDLLQPYFRGLNWLLVDNYDIKTRYPELKDIHITIDQVEDEKVCERLRAGLDERLRSEWFGEDLRGAGEEVYGEVVASMPRVHYWIRARGDVKSQ